MGKNDGLVLLGVGAAALYAMSKKAGASPGPDDGNGGDTGGSDFNLEIIRVSQGSFRNARRNIFPWMVRVSQDLTLEEGATYKIRANITNTSTRAGQPVGATFKVILSGSAGAVNFMPAQTLTAAFGPNEMKALESSNFIIPNLIAAVAGSVTGQLQTEDGLPISSASKAVDLVLAAMQISGTIGISGDGGTGGTTTGLNVTLPTTAPNSTTDLSIGAGSGALTLSWQPRTEAMQYTLYIGTTQGVSQILNESQGMKLSKVVNIPGTRPLYVRLWILLPIVGSEGNAWTFADYKLN
jgi:hypothetical protein